MPAPRSPGSCRRCGSPSRTCLRPLALPTDQARHYMFESVCDFFERAAAIQPMLIVLEDLHWADKSTTRIARKRGATRRAVGVAGDRDVPRRRPRS